jgi:hypothetical protein
MPEPRDAAIMTQGREDGWHGAEARVDRMMPTSHVWTTVEIVYSFGEGLGRDYPLDPLFLTLTKFGTSEKPANRQKDLITRRTLVVDATDVLGVQRRTT